MAARPDLNDRLIPSHVEQGYASEMSRNSTGADDLADDVDDSLGLHDPHSSGLVGKFRSSLKKKISIKGMSGLAKTTPPRAGPRKPEDEERADEEENDRSENVEDLEADVTEPSPGEVHEVTEETVETTTYSMEESGEVKKKKKKKKRRTRDGEVEEQEIEVVESTPVKTGAPSGRGTELPDFAESPVVTVETEEIEVTTETSASGKVKKTKRRTHKKKTHQNEEDDSQVF